MKNILSGAKVFIKSKLGLCNSERCYSRAIGEIKIDCINVKRCLCEKHLNLYKELIEKRYIVGIDLAKEEDNTSYIKVNKQIKEKSREERQLDKLNKLLKGVKKIRVKKKINKRIMKLKGDGECGELRRVS